MLSSANRLVTSAGSKRSSLRALSMNCQKAWNGVVNSLRIAVGTLLSPFIQALTGILRLVQMIVVAWNSIVGLAGAAHHWVPKSDRYQDR